MKHGEGKGILALLAGPPESSEDNDEDLGSEVKLQAARDLRRALKDGSDDAVMGAFQRMYDACAAERGNSDDEY